MPASRVAQAARAPDIFERLRTATRAHTPYHAATLTSPNPPGFAAVLRDARAGDSGRGRDVVSGRGLYAGQRVAAATPQALWATPGLSASAASWLHGFGWMRDVIAADGEAGARFAMAAIDAWIAGAGDAARDTALATHTTALRTLAWLQAAPIVMGPDDPGAAARREAVRRQAQVLARTATRAPAGLEQLYAALAVAAAGVCLEGEERLMATGLERLDKAIGRQILSDGGHVSRSPEVLCAIVADLSALSDALVSRGAAGNDTLTRGLARATAMLSFFRMPDGGLAAFHGGGEGELALLSAILGDAQARAFSVAPASGYQRAESAGAVVVMDCAGPAEPPDGTMAHASPLAFEFAAAGGRIFVNCGWSAGQPESFREPVRATAAHCALVVADTNAMRLGPGSNRRSGDPSGLVSSKRLEEELGVWIEGAHKGYREAFGVTHARRIYLATKGGDVRGEDTVLSDTASGHAHAFAIRFHVHPDVRIQPAPDGRSALVTVADGDCWRFRSDLAPLSVEPSIYLARGATPVETRQIVIAGRTEPSAGPSRTPNRVRWALQRLGRAPAA